MGKKTIKVPYTDKIEKSSMFCQSNADLLNIYPERALEGMYGCVIRPLEHSNDGYFFYRKKLPNGEMLVCGECYPSDNKVQFDEGVYYLDEDHEPNSCFFVEEDSLVNDDDDFSIEAFDHRKEDERKDKKLQQGLQKLEQSKPVAIAETRVYIINVNKCEMIGRSTSDEAFITEAEKQGTVYSLQKFEDAFNYDDITSDNCLVRIISNI